MMASHKGGLLGSIDKDVQSGAHGYTSFALKIYDYLVLGFMSNFVWRCSTSKVMIPFFQANVRGSTRLLDIGVATGYFLEHGNIPYDTEVTLCDLNPNCLIKAKERFGRPGTRTLAHDIFQPLPAAEKQFDAISMIYLLHCLPGPTSRKCSVLAHIKHNLTPDGVMFGSTVLGPTGNHYWFSRFALKRLNKKQHMDNLRDTETEFTETLRANYHDVNTRTVGALFMWTASRPIV